MIRILTEQQAFYRDCLRQHRKPVRLDKLVKELGVTDKASFVADLAALETAGEVILSKRGSSAAVLSVDGAGLVRGEIISASRHFSFMRPEGGGEDVYIPCEANGGALPGDKVIISLHDDGKGPSGSVQRLYAKGRRLVVGTVRRYQGKWELLADADYRVPLDIARNTVGAVVGDKVQARVSLAKNGRDMSCAILKIYGEAECARICADAIIDALGIPSVFSEEVLRSAEELSARGVTEEDIAGREDLRDHPIFTIDGEDAKDLDDAICVKKNADGYELSVHIADVSHYVRDESPLDREALARGTSVYFADRVIPMYPEAISNGICSLNAHTDKLTFSVFLQFDTEGKMLDYRFAKTVIDSKVRGVYAEVNAILDGTASNELLEKYAPVRQVIDDARELYEKLRSASDVRGNVHFTSLESRFVLDENGVCVGLRERESGTAEEMIEQFMIAANIAAAKLARRAQIPFVYRVHESPNPEALDRVAQLLRTLGVNTTMLSDNPSPADVDAVLTQVKDSPYENIVSNALLRAMAKARYDDQPLGHFGLALADYCHFTSPIRRYPDSFIHRVLSAYTEGASQVELVKDFDGKAVQAAELSSQCEMRAVTAERRTEACYMAEYLSHYIGEEFDGTVSGVAEHGMFVRLASSAEGLVPHDELPADDFEYDGIATYRSPSSGKTFRVGDTVRIRVAAAKIATGKVLFQLIPS